MEKYTETAAVEEHEISVDTYTDPLDHICISSEEDTKISLYMRNPQKFNMEPSVVFKNLDDTFSRASVTINQIDVYTTELFLPQDFLIPVDGGHDITAEISLHEPMSGRDFDKYELPLHCNTIPPQILNPTILNNNGQSFVLAFDMPNDEEVAVRHTDLCAVEINGVSYPVEISTEEDAEGVKHAVYNFPNSLFTRTASPDYIAIGGKTFSENQNSVYFETNEPVIASEKTYTLVLKDQAGLFSTVSASTTISKLQKPVIKNQQGAVILESVNGSFTGIPFDEDTTIGKITIIPPTKDHHDNDLSGVPLVYYKIYEATGSGRIYSSGTTTTELEIELPQNTYRVEAYATLVNYEQSATTTVKFRFVNNAIYVKSDAEDNGDGSERWPWKTIAEAFADINGDDRRRESKYILYLDGDFNEFVVVDGSLNTDALEIQKYPRASSASVNMIQVGGTSGALDSDFVLDIGEITISNDNANENGIVIKDGIKVTIDGANLTHINGDGIEIDNVDAEVTFKSGEISHSINGIAIEHGTLNFESGTISENSQSGIQINNGTVLNFTNGTVTKNSENGIYIAGSGIADITNCSITNNEEAGIYIATGGSCRLFGGTISGNKDSGIVVNGTLNVSGNILVQGNTRGSPAESSNVLLSTGKVINVTDSLASTSKIWVRTASAPSGTNTLAITSGYGSNNSRAPAYTFFSDIGYGIILEGGEVKISQSQGSIFTQFDYSVTFKPGDGSNSFDQIIDINQDKEISVVPVIRRNGVDITSTIPEGDLSWNIFVTCHNDVVVTSDTNSITISKNVLMDDVYYVHINLTYLNRLFDYSFSLKTSLDEILFESYSLDELSELIKGMTSGGTILLPHGLTCYSYTEITVPEGQKVTIRRTAGYTGTLLTAESGNLVINKPNEAIPNPGTLILDGDSDNIVADEPLFVDDYGVGDIYNVVFQNNNNANGDGGGISAGYSTNTRLYNCHFINCHARNGGAGYFYSDVTIGASTDSEYNFIIKDCSAVDRGGGLYLIAWDNRRGAAIGNSYEDLDTNIIGCTAGSGSGSGNRIWISGDGWTVELFRGSNQQNISYDTPID